MAHLSRTYYILNPLLFICLSATVLAVQLDGNVGENDTNAVVTCERQCVHGVCDIDGVCMCDGCWVGQYCQDYANEHPPQFLKTYDHADVNLASTSPIVYQAEARDEDAVVCGRDTDCPCAKIVYELVDANSINDGLFAVDATSGAVTLTGTALMYKESEYRITLRAANDDGFGFHEMALTLTIVGPFEDNWKPRYAETDGKIPNIGESSADNYRNQIRTEFSDFDDNPYKNSFQGPEPNSDYDSSQPHSRQRRAAPTFSGGNSATEVTFWLWREDDSTDETDVYIGEKVCLEMAIQFPATATTDMYVELFTPNNATTYMKLCSVSVVPGSALSSTELSDINNNIKYEAKDASPTEWDIAVITLGDVVNDGTGIETDAMVRISFCAILLDVPELTADLTEYLSAGAEYSAGANVWVGMAPYTLKPGLNDHANDNTFAVDGPDEVAIGSPVTFKVTGNFYDQSTNLIFDAFTPLDDVDALTVCNVAVLTSSGNIGSSMACSIHPDLEATLNPSETESTSNYHGQLAVGNVLNQDSLGTPTADGSKLIFEATYLLDYEGITAEQTYSVGLALNIGETEIWAAIVEFTAKASLPSVGLAPSTIAFGVEDNNLNTKQGETKAFRLDVDIPTESNAPFTLEVSSPGGASPLFKMCAAWLIVKGYNVPCFGQRKPVLTGTDPALKTTVTWDMGYIANTNTRDAASSWLFENITDTINQISIGFAVQATDNWSSGTGTIAPVLKRYDGGAETELSVSSVDLSFVAGTMDTLSSAAPEFTICFYDDAAVFTESGLAHAAPDIVPVGGSRDIRIKIQTMPADFYSPMDVEIILPFENGLPIMSVCSVEVVRVGQNLPCVDMEYLNTLIDYTTRTEDYPDFEHWDKATFSIGPISNIQTLDPVNTVEDEIELKIVVKMEDHPDNAGNHWVSAGVSYADDRLWVGQIQVTSATASANTLSAADFYFNVERHRNTGDDDAMVNVNTVYRVVVKVPPFTDAAATLTATATGGEGFSICNIRVIGSGDNIACGNTSLIPEFTPHTTASNGNQIAVLDLGMVSNIGELSHTDDMTADSNTIEFLVVGRMTTAGTYGIDFDFSVTGDGAAVDLTQVQKSIGEASALTPIPETTPATNVLTVAKFADDGDTTDDIRVGETKLVHLTIGYSEYVAKDTTVTFTTPDDGNDYIEIVSAGVVSVGDNLPCLMKEHIAATLTPRVADGVIASAELALGHVCHIPITSGAAGINEVVVEVAVRVRPRGDALPAIADNTVVQLGVAIAYTDVGLPESPVSLDHDLNIRTGDAPVVNPNAVGATLEFVNTDSPIEFEPAERMDLVVKAVIPANTTRVLSFDVQTAWDTSAMMVVEDITVISAGANLGAIEMYTKEDYYTSIELIPQIDAESTQNTYGILILGPVTNDGHTYRTNTIVEDDEADNTIEFSIKVQMADSDRNDVGAAHNLSVGLQLSDEIAILPKLVSTVRTADPAYAPDICLALALETNTYSAGDTITIEGKLVHNEDSNAEGHDITASFYIPPSLEFLALGDNNHTALTVDSTEVNIVKFQLPNLFFTDHVGFEFTLRVLDPTVSAELSAPYEASSKTHNDDEPDKYYFTRLDNLAISFNYVPAAGCTPGPLGLSVSSSQIADCQISGSPSAFGSSHVDVRAGGSGWQPATRYGNQKYVQLSFGNSTRITQIDLATSDAAKKPETVTAKYSDDGITWINDEEFTPSWSGTSATLVVTSPQSARYLRLYAAKADEDAEINMQVELQGCFSPDGITVEAACARSVFEPTVDPGVAADIYYSGFVVGGDGNLTFCDAVPDENDNLQHTCVHATDDGNNFQVINRDVKNVIGYDSETQELFGIGWDDRSYMISSPDTDYTAWLSVSPDAFTEARNKPTYTTKDVVEWAPSASVTHNPWTADPNGIFYSGSKIADWKQCCRP